MHTRQSVLHVEITLPKHARPAKRVKNIRFVLLLIYRFVVFLMLNIRRGEDMGVKNESMIVLFQTLEAADFGDICSRFFLGRSLRFRGLHACDCLLLGLRDATREGGA